jgi:tetratricopeptide (TPR) repeat protein
MKVDSSVMEKFRPFLHEGDSLVSEIRFEITDRGRPKSYITKSQLMCLDLLANMDWSRPVYFAVTTGGDAYLGLEQYFQLEGLAYRLTPILHTQNENPNLEGGVGTDIMYKNMMESFRWGNMDKEELYLDENNRRMTSNLRLQFSHLADQLVQEGRKDDAVKVLDRCIEVMPEKNVPYDQIQIMWQIAEIYYDAGADDKALALSKRLIDLNKQEIEFYNSLDAERRDAIKKDVSMRARVMDRLVAQAEEHFPGNDEVKQIAKENDEILNKDFMEELGMDPREREALRRKAGSSPKLAPAANDTIKETISVQDTTTDTAKGGVKSTH